MVERIAFEPDGRGRPPLAYRVTERGGSVFPSDDGLVQTPCQLESRFLSQVVGAPLLRKSIASHHGEPCKFEFILEDADA